ncbi:hypothetical protein M9H77_01214 [Catharanthus roseus]|uniref:Uncharacterized protein n=1 Tax=Catharanthus roseus TaxID=4058 RepID=A0ACC0C4V5_CATRO|nr:hypothetical protein M9H77_01214 [Catharanthus roseus]
MAHRLERLKEISELVFKVYSGTHGYRSSRGGIDLHYLHLRTSRCVCAKISKLLECGIFDCRRYSTVPKRIHKQSSNKDFLSFVQSAINELQGPSHRWLNKVEVPKCFFRKDGIFLVLAGQFVGDASVAGCNLTTVSEKVKLLQRRYPSLQVMGFQYSPAQSSDAVSTDLIQKIMVEYITFPVLLSNKYFSEMKDGAYYVIFKGFHNPMIYHAKDIDIVTLDRAVKTLITENCENSRLMNKLERSWANPIQTVKEPYLSSFLRNLLLYYPGAISVDEDCNRLFLSDVNHHRIVIFDHSGKILDCIGSSPGFEDGEFENAKLMRPAASFYHAPDDCLYFVDSENHAIRRANMERRVVETIYPTNTVKKTSLWSWILDKFGKKQDTETKSDELHHDTFLFPWHLMKSTNDDIFVLNRSFETLWIMDLTSGIIKEVVKGFPKILEISGQMIKERALLMKHMPDDWLVQQVNTSYSLDGIPHAGLMSSVAKFKDNVIICDEVGQMVLRLDIKSGSTSSFQFSNFGILGLPYWCSFPLEKVCARDEELSEMHIDHIGTFRLLPGRVTIMLNVEIPEDMDLAEPLEENSVWCQARGSAIEVSGAETRVASVEKVGVAQQWYDEIDNLTVATSEDSSMKEEINSPDEEVEEGRVRINCTVSTSPGTSEVIIYAPLYLKLKKTLISSSDGQAEIAARLAEIIDPAGIPRRASLIQFLLRSKKNLHDLVFLKPLHVRLKFKCDNHPKADNSKNIVLTDSSIDVNVAFGKSRSAHH